MKNMKNTFTTSRNPFNFYEKSKQNILVKSSERVQTAKTKASTAMSSQSTSTKIDEYKIVKKRKEFYINKRKLNFIKTKKNVVVG